jgi:DNA primase
MIATDVVTEIKKVAVTTETIQMFIPLKPVGKGYTAKCPFHEDESESLTVIPKLNVYKCFGCGKSGDSINFLMDHVGMTYPKALEYLADKYKIQIN